VGERIRRGLDLEDWPAFGRSFDAFVDLLRSVGAPHGAVSPPSTVCVLSGDVHFSYAADVALDGAGGSASTRIHQLVSSPIRNALRAKERTALRFALSRAGIALGRVLRRSVRARRPPVRWTMTDGPVFANSMSLLRFDGDRADLLVEQASPGDDGAPALVAVVARAL
jgi:hypothetical protein